MKKMKLRHSILQLESYEFPCPYKQSLYLNLEEGKIEVWDGSGWPRASAEGRWRLACDVLPSGNCPVYGRAAPKGVAALGVRH